MIQKVKHASTLWLDVEAYVPLDKFYHLVNQSQLAHFATLFLFCFTTFFGRTHPVGLTVCYASTLAALLPVVSYIWSRSQTNAAEFVRAKQTNARDHAVLLVVTYSALLFDNFMYFYDK